MGIQQQAVQLYKSAIEIAREQNAGYQQMLAGIVNHLLGMAYSYDKQSVFGNTQAANQINKAKLLMAENLNSGITPEQIAARVNMSYSWFRRLFKQYTGLAPVNYMQEVRINKSKELLTNSRMAIKEIAFETGFTNPEYFYSLFRKKTGYTPNGYREFTQGKGIG